LSVGQVKGDGVSQASLDLIQQYLQQSRELNQSGAAR